PSAKGLPQYIPREPISPLRACSKRCSSLELFRETSPRVSQNRLGLLGLINFLFLLAFPNVLQPGNFRSGRTQREWQVNYLDGQRRDDILFRADEARDHGDHGGVAPA